MLPPPSRAIWEYSKYHGTDIERHYLFAHITHDVATAVFEGLVAQGRGRAPTEVGHAGTRVIT